MKYKIEFTKDTLKAMSEGITEESVQGLINHLEIVLDSGDESFRDTYCTTIMYRDDGEFISTSHAEIG